jgi:hypothetical protein
MRYFLLVLILFHGLIHILGFIKAFNLTPVSQLTQNISKPVGLLWMLVTILFLLSFVLFLIGKDSWWMFCTPAVVTSQILITINWTDAKYGTIPNFILMIPIIIAFAGNLPSSYKNIFKAEVEKKLNRVTPLSILKEEEIKHLPIQVQKYLIYTGAVGKEKVQNVRAVFKGGIRLKPESGLLDFNSVQYNFYDDPARAFYIESKLYGLPFDGLHLYIGLNATMQIKIASLFQIVDAKGPEMNKGETVTLFNDMCILNPGSLIDKNIEWDTVDSFTVKARYSNQGNTITATLYFNEIGELINFSSDDRFESSDGRIYKNYTWTTPIRNYKVYNNRKVPSYGEAIWRKPEGEFCYGKFNLVEIDYNLKEYK